MTMPSPFELGRSIGGNVSSGINAGIERNAIDDILEQANASGNPEDINNAMTQILQRVSPERQQAALQILQMKQQQISQQRQAQAYQEQGLNPYLPESINKELIKKRGEGSDQQKAYKNSLDLVKRAKEIVGTGHLGPKIGIVGTGRKFGSTFSPEGQRLRAEYQQIGKALVQAAAPLKITNKAEFQHYAEDLEDPKRNIEDIQGTIAALERIIRNSMGEQESSEQQYVNQQSQSPGQQEKRVEKPSLQSFFR